MVNSWITNCSLLISDYIAPQSGSDNLLTMEGKTLAVDTQFPRKRPYSKIIINKLNLLFPSCEEKNMTEAAAATAEKLLVI